MERALFDQILEKGRDQGRQLGREEGFQQGLERGRQEGLAAMQEAVLEILRDRLGTLDRRLEARVRALDDFDPLTYLLIDLARPATPVDLEGLLARLERYFVSPSRA